MFRSPRDVLDYSDGVVAHLFAAADIPSVPVDSLLVMVCVVVEQEKCTAIPEASRKRKKRELLHVIGDMV